MLAISDIDIEKLENISKITLDDLRNPEVFNRLKELAAEIDNYGLLKEANYLLEYLVRLLDRHKELAQSEPQFFKDYQKLIVYLKFLTLLSQPISEIENLFRKHLLLAFQRKIDLKERLRLLFLIKSDEDTGYNIRRAVIKAMEANEEKVGRENLAGEAGGLPVYPYIKSWLRDYIAFFSAKKEERGEFEQATYLSQSKNVKKLSAEEKEVLAEVIKLYDYLRFPEEEKREVRATGHIPTKILSRPKVEVVNKTRGVSKSATEVDQVKRVNDNKAINELAELRELAASYPAGSLERRVIEEEIKRREIT